MLRNEFTSGFENEFVAIACAIFLLVFAVHSIVSLLHRFRAGVKRIEKSCHENIIVTKHLESDVGELFGQGLLTLITFCDTNHLEKTLGGNISGIEVGNTTKSKTGLGIRNDAHIDTLVAKNLTESLVQLNEGLLLSRESDGIRTRRNPIRNNITIVITTDNIKHLPINRLISKVDSRSGHIDTDRSRTKDSTSGCDFNRSGLGRNFLLNLLELTIVLRNGSFRLLLNLL